MPLPRLPPSQDSCGGCWSSSVNSFCVDSASFFVPFLARWNWVVSFFLVCADGQTMEKEPAPVKNIEGAFCLLHLGDSITTDHISPAGNIAVNSPAAKYLLGRGIQRKDFNTYGARRGNDEVRSKSSLLVQAYTRGAVYVFFFSASSSSLFRLRRVASSALGSPGASFFFLSLCLGMSMQCVCVWMASRRRFFDVRVWEEGRCPGLCWEGGGRASGGGGWGLDTQKRNECLKARSERRRNEAFFLSL